MNGLIKNSLFFFIIFLASTTFANNHNSSAEAYKLFKEGLKLEQSLYIFEANNYFQKALAIDPGNSGYLSHYAWFLHFYEFPEEANIFFKKAIKNPQGPPIYFYKGLAWNEKITGNLDESITAYQHAYSSRWLKSNYSNAFTKASMMVYEENERKIAQLKKQLARDPNNFNVQKELFNHYLYQGNFHKVIALGKSLMLNRKTDNFMKLQFARALYRDGQFVQAAIYYQQLMRQFPHNAYLAYEWGSKLVEIHQYNAAYVMLTASLSYYPTFQAKMALVHLEVKRRDCPAAWNLIHSIPPQENTSYLLNMGDVYRTCGQYQQANRYYHMVLQQYPYNTDALWGILSSTATAQDYTGNRKAYDRWQEVYIENRSFTQNQLVNYYQSPLLQLIGDYYNNSITFKRQEAGGGYDFYAATNTRLNVFYNYSAFSENGFDDISRNVVAVYGSEFFSEHFQLSGEISDKDYSNNNNNVNDDISLQYSWSPNLKTIFDFQHIDIIDTQLPFNNQIYNYVVSIGAIGLNIKTNDYSGAILYQPNPKIYLWSKLTLGDYSDGNTKTEDNIEASYQLIEVPRIRIMYDYFYLNFADPAPIFTQNNNSESAYYDPKNFQVHTGKINIEHFFTESLRAGIENGESFFPQNSSFANTTNSYIDYRPATHIEARLDAQYFNQNESIGRNNVHGNSFWAKNIMLSLIYKI